MKPTINSLHQAMLLFLLLLLLFSCKKEIAPASVEQDTNSKAVITTQSNARKVYVSTVAELYAAINNPENEGYEVVLAPGTYTLRAVYPHSGRIELLHNMSLSGQPGHPEAVVIDVTALPASSLTVPPSPTFPGNLRTGVIRTGNGSNAIEWLTVQNDTTHNLRSLIQTDLVATPATQLRVAHTILKGASMGINIQNRDAVSKDRSIEADIEDNDIAENTVPPFGAGIQIQNSQAVSGSRIRATLKRNYIHGNKVGLSAFNGSAIQNTIIITSYDNRFEDNGLGLALVGGFGENADFPTLDNTTFFEAHGTTIRNNTGLLRPQPAFTTGGVFAAAGTGNVATRPGTVHNNKLTVNFWGSVVDGNAGPFDINAFGARTLFPSATPVGTNNKAVIDLKGISKQATVNAVASYPAEPAGTNTVTVTR